MTNYQRIKDMNIEELAEFNIRDILIEEDDYDYDDNLSSIIIDGFQTSDGRKFRDYDDAFEHELNWLKQEYKSKDCLNCLYQGRPSYKYPCYKCLNYSRFEPK